MTDTEQKALGVRHAKITGKDMRDHWGPIVERIADEISDPRDDLIEAQAREIERLTGQLNQIAWLAQRPYDPHEQLTGGEGYASEGQAGSEA